MLVTRLELRNFRCFETLDLDLSETTVLVGANDTGKSAVLEAVRLLFGEWPVHGADWTPIVRDDGTPSRDRPAASIVGHVDLGGEALEWFGPSAPNGVVRLGACSDLPGHWIVLEESELPALIDALDPALIREYFGVEGMDQVLDALEESGELLFEREGRSWLDPGIWEFAAGYTLGGWDLTDYGRRLVTCIALGESRDTTWSPQAVVDPIVRRAIARDGVYKPLHSPVDRRSGLNMPAPIEQLGEAHLSVQRAIDALLEHISAVHTSTLQMADDDALVTWQAPIDLADAMVRAIEATFRPGSPPGREVSIDSLGPGTRRSLAVAALELYRDPLLWPTRDEDNHGLPALGLLLVEEPESGLHPAAQRALARIYARVGFLRPADADRDALSRLRECRGPIRHPSCSKDWPGSRGRRQREDDPPSD